MKLLRSRLVLILCLAARMLYAESPGEWCPAREIPVSASGIPVQFAHLRFASIIGSSIVDVEATSQDAKPIRDYLILVELLKENNEHILTIPLYDVRVETKLRTPFAITFSQWLYAHENSTAVLESNKTVELNGSSPVVTFLCPAKARIAAVHFKYVDGEEFHASPGELQLDPVPILATILSPTITKWAPVFVTADLLVNSHGNGQLRNLSPNSEEFVNLIQGEAKGWRFSAPVGKETRSELGFFAFIEDVATQGSELPEQTVSYLEALRHQTKAPLAIVLHAYRADPHTQTWSVVAGGYFWRVYIDQLPDSQH